MFKILSLSTALALGTLALATSADARGGHGGHGGPSMSHSGPTMGGFPGPRGPEFPGGPVVVRDHRGPLGSATGGVIVTDGFPRGNLRGFPPVGWGTKLHTGGMHRRHGGALGIGGSATPNVRCPRGAFCAF